MNQSIQTKETTRWTPRRIILGTLFVVAVGLAFWLLYRFRLVVLILFVAIIIGTAVKPAVRWLNEHGVPKLYASILIFLLLLAAIVGFLVIALPLVLNQATVVGTQVTLYYLDLRSWLTSSESEIIRTLGYRMPLRPELQRLVEDSSTSQAPGPEEAIDTVALAFTYTSVAARSLFFTIAVFLMAFYWNMEEGRAIRSISLFVPLRYRDGFRDLVEAIETRVGGFLIGQTALCVIIGLMQLAAYLIIGLPNALLLGLIAGITEAIPIVGPALGALPAILIALSTDPTKAIWVLLSTGIVQGLENSLLVPRIMQRSVGVNPLLTLLALAALSSVLGFAGALLAIPLAAIIQLLADRYLFKEDAQVQIDSEQRDYVSLLRYQAREIAQDANKIHPLEGEEESELGLIEEEIEALANEIDGLLEQTNPQEKSRS